MEHLGRCVYTGILEPEHPTADTDGFRTDVLELTRELGVSTVRYPGGTSLAADTARGMRMVDPDLGLVVCGSSAPTMPTFGEWERVVLTETYDLVDLISAHQYLEDVGDLQEYLAAGHKMESFIRDIVAHADHVKSGKKSAKQVNISFDEWNAWHMSRAESKSPTGTDWPVAPALLEDKYTVADAVAVGDLLITLLRNTDRVHAASLAQLVNVIAPIMTEPGGRGWKQTIFHPFALTSRHAAGTVLQLAVSGDTTADFAALSAAATLDADKGEAVILAVNRSVTDALTLDAAVAGLGSVRVVEALTYANEDPHWQATVEDSTSVLPAQNVSVNAKGGWLTAVLPAMSWSMIRLALDS
ncbi:alpha-L-arabinofuranosidase C-terminal domain-containing protein [Pseudarthrobacter sp. S3]|uniref:alpha-L-arabinofuranosidase C-terminal domain-containing protein n=1 Tax=Pseudarthrobacter sp. S3 TaxID=3418419 RepID=UPI003CF8C1F3